MRKIQSPKYKGQSSQYFIILLFIAALFVFINIPISPYIISARATSEEAIETDLEATYGQTLADISLETFNSDFPGVTWKDSTTSVGNVGTNSFPAIYANTDESSENYNTAIELYFIITVNKAEIPISIISETSLM